MVAVLRQAALPAMCDVLSPDYILWQSPVPTASLGETGYTAGGTAAGHPKSLNRPCPPTYRESGQAG